MTRRYLTWFEEHTSTMSREDLEFAAKIVDQLNSTTNEDGCIYQSLLKLWNTKNPEEFNELSKEDLLRDVTIALNDT